VGVSVAAGGSVSSSVGWVVGDTGVTGRVGVSIGGRVGVIVAVETGGSGVAVEGETWTIIVGVKVGCPSWLARKTAAMMVRITTIRTPAPITRRCTGEVGSLSLGSIDTINSPYPERYIH
jgi:hypothetical protein